MAKLLWSLWLAIVALTWIWPVHSLNLPLASDTNDNFEDNDDDDSDDDGYGTDEDSKALPEHYERYFPPKENECTLRTFDAEKEAELVREWYDLIKTPIDEETSLRQLLIEACDDDEKNLYVMCYSFISARSANKCLPGMTRAECIAVYMYTSESGGFYREYNNASSYGIWAPYRVYTSLLYSALQKLAVIDPIPHNAKLYRGIRLTCQPPDTKKIYWKTFTSTSLDQGIANFFGTSTSIIFEEKATTRGARIRNLSAIDVEDEVLIPPFEVFDFLREDGQTFIFSSSQTQELLYDRDSNVGNVQLSIVALTIILMLSSLLITLPL